MQLRRTMTVARMGDGRLVIHNGIALDEPSMKRLEAWGQPAFLIVPNRGHRLDAPAFKRRYPSLAVYSPRGGRKVIEQVVPVDGTFDEFRAGDSVELEHLAGVAESEGVMRVRSSDGVTLVLNDAVFNMDLPSGFMFRMMVKLLGSAPGPRVSRLAKWVYVKDKAAFSSHLQRLAETPELVRLIVAHDSIAHGTEAAAALRSAAQQAAA
jgi:hypothetical protein